jgi:hypothetical protein
MTVFTGLASVSVGDRCTVHGEGGDWSLSEEKGDRPLLCFSACPYRPRQHLLSHTYTEGPSISSNKGSQLAQEIFALDGAPALTLPLILSLSYLRTHIADSFTWKWCPSTQMLIPLFISMNTMLFTHNHNRRTKMCSKDSAQLVERHST